MVAEGSCRGISQRIPWRNRDKSAIEMIKISKLKKPGISKGRSSPAVSCSMIRGEGRGIDTRMVFTLGVLMLAFSDGVFVEHLRSSYLHFINFQTKIHQKTTAGFAVSIQTPPRPTLTSVPCNKLNETKWRLKVELKEGMVQTVGMQDKTPWYQAE